MQTEKNGDVEVSSVAKKRKLEETTTDTSVSIKQEEIPEDPETSSPKDKKKDKKEKKKKKKKEKQETEGEESMVMEEDASGVIRIILIIRCIKKFKYIFILYNTSVYYRNLR